MLAVGGAADEGQLFVALERLANDRSGALRLGDFGKPRVHAPPGFGV